MASAALKLEPRCETMADLLHRLGDIPPERVLMHPPPGTATEKDVIEALEAPRKRICELVEGVLVEKPMGAREAPYATVLLRHLETFAEKHDLGIVLPPDGTVRIMPGMVRIPDVSFTPWEDIPNQEMPAEPIPDLVPALAVEVISEGNTPKEIKRKLREYFEAGVSVVWLVYPQTQTAEVYSSPTKHRSIEPDGMLEGGKQLPGFQLLLKKIFARARRRQRRK